MTDTKEDEESSEAMDEGLMTEAVQVSHASQQEDEMKRHVKTEEHDHDEMNAAEEMEEELEVKVQFEEMDVEEEKQVEKVKKVEIYEVKEVKEARVGQEEHEGKDDKEEMVVKGDEHEVDNMDEDIDEEENEDDEKEEGLSSGEDSQLTSKCLDRKAVCERAPTENKVHLGVAEVDSTADLHDEIPLPSGNKNDIDREETYEGDNSKEKTTEAYADILASKFMVVDKMNPKNDDKLPAEAKSYSRKLVKCEGDVDTDSVSVSHVTNNAPLAGSSAMEADNVKNDLVSGSKAEELPGDTKDMNASQTFLFEADASDDGDSGTEELQSAFVKDIENFCKEKGLEFKPPKFYGEPLNLLKLWRGVIRLGGYDKVTACKLWRQVGESFKPPKTCTTVSWTFRIFYEKALLDYERYKIHGGELGIPVSLTEPINVDTQVGNNSASGSGRARRDAAARAMQGWHSQRLLGNGEVSDPIIKDKSSIAMQKKEKQLKNIGVLKRKKPSPAETPLRVERNKVTKAQLDSAVVDIGPPADWVQINVRVTKDCYEVYALVPGLLREEVRVQSDPAGRLVITGEPENPDNPWGVTPFKKVVSLPSRIDPHQTSAVVTLHGQLFVRVPFEQSD